MPEVLTSLKQKAKSLKTEIYVLYLAYKDPRVPWYAKAFMLVVVAYFLSPIDLIPDFIPVLGYVDDLIIVPAGIFLALKMIPRDVMEECRGKARSEPIAGKAKWIATLVIISVWLLVLYFLVRFIWQLFA
jgi:uncharacterized membrane protein YkvA (DUF1232 family)